jgi:multiple sugar transport system permease protein
MTAAAPAPRTERPRKVRKYGRKETLVAYGLLAIPLLGTLMFRVLPGIGSFWLSFTQWNLITAPEMVGLANFERMLTDPLFWKATLNTIYYVGVTVPLVVAVSLGMALLLNRKVRGIGVFRTIYFLPVVSSMVAVAVMWRWMLNPDYGLVNAFLALFGIDGPSWLGTSQWAMPSIIMVSVWREVGFYMIILLAALQGVPRNLLEAASIDGAGPWQRFWGVTFPMISPSVFLVSIMALINNFQAFDLMYVMTEGGPQNATTNLVVYLYQQGFQFFDIGYGSAIALVLFLMILGITLLQWRVGERRVVY